jgi:hypothetical protein
MLAQVLISPDFRPKIIVILVCGHLAVHEVANAGEEHKE